MRNAIIGALLIAAVSTLGDFVWAGLHLRHRVVYGLAHGTILFLGMGAYFGWVRKKPSAGALYGAGIGFAAAGSFYLLAPIAGYAVMFVVWAFVWIALAFVAGASLARGVLAMIGSGLGFYLISDIWRPFNPEGWDYAIHFLSWTVAYLPGFAALLYPARRRQSSVRRGGMRVARIPGEPTSSRQQGEWTVQDTREIPRDTWDTFFSRFSNDHETQFVAIEVMGKEIGAQVEGRTLLLSGISRADKDGDLALTFDSVDGEHLTHMVTKPTHVWIQQAADQTDAALEIESADGTRTLLRFPPYEPERAAKTTK